MLTVSQVATVAFGDGDPPICPQCASDRHGALCVAKVEAGLSDALQRVSEYELGEWESEEAWAHAESVAQERGVETQEVYDEQLDGEEYHYQCDGCGRFWTGGGATWVEREDEAVRAPQPGDQRWLW